MEAETTVKLEPGDKVWWKGYNKVAKIYGWIDYIESPEKVWITQNHQIGDSLNQRHRMRFPKKLKDLNLVEKANK